MRHKHYSVKNISLVTTGSEEFMKNMRKKQYPPDVPDPHNYRIMVRAAPPSVLILRTRTLRTPCAHHYRPFARW